MEMQLGNVREDATKNAYEDNSECEDVYTYATCKLQPRPRQSIKTPHKASFFFFFPTLVP